jgi:DNA replication protein DnaC
VARTCPFGVCDGSGIVVDEATRTSSYCRCRGQVVATARARGLSAVIPKKYRGVSFDRPPITTIREGIVAQVRRYVREIDERLDAGGGLWLHGPVGTGKTSLAMLVSKAALDAGRTVAIYSLPRLLAEIRTTFDEDSLHSYTDLLDRLTGVDLLHIDDVGAEKTSPWVLEQLYALINTRYEEERAVIITTNLERDELAEQINERTVSRLEEMCEILPIWGRDLRQRVYDGRSAGTSRRGAPPTLRRTCQARSSWAPSGATRARARSSTCLPSTPMSSSASRAATTRATPSCTRGRRGSSTSSRPASCTRARRV